jgi:histone H3/H4
MYWEPFRIDDMCLLLMHLTNLAKGLCGMCTRMARLFFASVFFPPTQPPLSSGVRKGMTVSKEFVASITSATQGYIVDMQYDLESFAKHARRGTVQPDDVRLCARRNPDVVSELERFAEQEGIKMGTAAGRKKKQQEQDKAKAKAQAQMEEEEGGRGEGGEEHRDERWRDGEGGDMNDFDMH